MAHTCYGTSSVHEQIIAIPYDRLHELRQGSLVLNSAKKGIPWRTVAIFFAAVFSTLFAMIGVLSVSPDRFLLEDMDIPFLAIGTLSAILWKLRLLREVAAVGVLVGAILYALFLLYVLIALGGV